MAIIEKGALQLSDGQRAVLIERLIESISPVSDSLSEAWGRISDVRRNCHLRRFPYSLIYSVDASGELLIVAIFHQNREPASWRDNERDF